MLTGPFTGGVTIYAFYAMQPYLLELWGDQRAFGIAGLAAATVAGAQIAGGLLVPHIKLVFGRRTTVLLTNTLVSVAVLAVIGLAPAFWVVITLLSLWALMFAAVTPVRQAYLNTLIESKQRATVLSFDSLLGLSGAAVTQPLLGKTADVWCYPTSYLAMPGSRRWRSHSAGWRSASACRRTRCWRKGRRCDEKAGSQNRRTKRPSPRGVSKKKPPPPHTKQKKKPNTTARNESFELYSPPTGQRDDSGHREHQNHSP